MKKFLTICCIFLLCSYSKAQEKSVWVSDLNLSLFDLDMGQATKNKTMMGSPLIVSGTTFENGVGTMAPSKCLIDLNGAGIRFLAEVGPAEMKFRGGGPGAPAPGGNAAPAGPGGAPAGGAMPPGASVRGPK